MKKNILISIILLYSAGSFADQCAVISRDQAAKAVFELMEAQKIQNFCEPCGDIVPREVILEKIAVVPWRNSQRDVQVVLNGKLIDLAYTYVEGVNLATLADCPTIDVSDTIE